MSTVSFGELTAGIEWFTPVSTRERLLDKGVPERIAALAKKHDGITLEVAEGDDLFFGDSQDTGWNEELLAAIRKAQEELCTTGEKLPLITIKTVSASTT